MVSDCSGPLCHRVTLVLVTPCWPAQPWFPHLMEMLVNFPRVHLHPFWCQMITPSPNCTSPVLTLQIQLVVWKVYIRRQLRAGAISEDAVNLILASWREKYRLGLKGEPAPQPQHTLLSSPKNGSHCRT